MSELISSAEKPLSPAAERMRLTRQRRAHMDYGASRLRSAILRLTRLLRGDF